MKRKQLKLMWLPLAAAALLAWPGQPRADTVGIERMELGSGEPGQGGFEAAQVVENNIFHAPQYLPGSPTAAMLWPRVIQVRCGRAGEVVRCEGYHWSPALGRAEYLYFTPVQAGPEAPAQ